MHLDPDLSELGYVPVPLPSGIFGDFQAIFQFRESVYQECGAPREHGSWAGVADE
jgi:hypothetical protein